MKVVKEWGWEAHVRLDPLTVGLSNPAGQAASGGISEVRSHAGFMPAIGALKTRLANREDVARDTIWDKDLGRAAAAVTRRREGDVDGGWPARHGAPRPAYDCRSGGSGETAAPACLSSGL
jgi:hypothetical protein